MAVEPEVHMGDIGTKFLITVKDEDAIVDISQATTKDFLFLKPDEETTVLKAGTFETDGVDGQLYYITETDFLDQEGFWKYQVHIIRPGKEHHSTYETKKVYPNIVI